MLSAACSQPCPSTCTVAACCAAAHLCELPVAQGRVAQEGQLQQFEEHCHHRQTAQSQLETQLNGRHRCTRSVRGADESNVDMGQDKRHSKQRMRVQSFSSQKTVTIPSRVEEKSMACGALPHAILT